MRTASALLLVAACVAGCDPAPPRELLDAHQLHLQAQQLASVCAEAVLFTDELSAGHLNQAFAWVHQQALADQVRHVQAGLTQAAPEPLQAPQRAALLLAAMLQAELTRIAPQQGQPEQLRALRERFDGLRQQARALESA